MKRQDRGPERAAVAIALSIAATLLTTAATSPHQLGSQTTAHDSYHVKLPYPSSPDGQNMYTLTQGNSGAVTHCSPSPKTACLWGEEYAFDFALPDGAPVAAAHGGVVSAFRMNMGHGTCDRKYINEANYIVIDHGDGTSALYLHLLQGSAQVEMKEAVQQGQIIAKADHSGYTCSNDGKSPGPHLHFQVQETTGGCQVYCQSVPVYFEDVQTDGASLKAYTSYKSGNAAPNPPPVEERQSRKASVEGRAKDPQRGVAKPPFFCVGGIPGPDCEQGASAPIENSGEQANEEAVQEQQSEQQSSEQSSDSCPDGMVRVGPETEYSSGCGPAGNSNEPEEEASPTEPDEGEYRDQVCPPECPDGEEESVDGEPYPGCPLETPRCYG